MWFAKAITNPAVFFSQPKARKDEEACKTTPKSSSSARPYPKPSDLPPIGQSLFSNVWDRDPTPTNFKTLYLTLVALGLTCLWFLSAILTDILSPLIHLDPTTKWDETHNTGLMLLMQETLGLSQSQVEGIGWITLAVCFTLIGADIVLGILYRNATNASTLNDKKSPSKVYPWPVSWNTDNYECYHDMFSEPTRHGRLLRRPGNTMSNFTYLFTSLSVFASSWLSKRNNTFWVADTAFAVMLLLLTIFSILWHGCNPTWVHYLDLWSMDSCIVYLIIRSAALGGACALHTYLGLLEETAKWWGATACACIYAGLIVALGMDKYGLFQKQYLHRQCLFSIRNRLLGVSKMFGGGHIDMHISNLCTFFTLPVYYLSVPTAIQITLIGRYGSITAGNWACRSLVIGWTYRMWERFALDGNPIMTYMVEKKDSPMLRMMGAAFFSGTAQMHFWTGITLLTGYMQTRSLERDYA